MNLSELVVVKRSGQRVDFNGTKIAVAIKCAFDSVEFEYTEKDVYKVYSDVVNYICDEYCDRKTINVEDIQDIIEEKLKKNNYKDVYTAFNSYRLQRSISREMFSAKQQHKFVKAVEKLGLRSNSSLDSSPLEIIMDFGKTISNEFSKAYLIDNKYVRAHDEGTIYIHDMDYYPVTAISMLHLDLKSIVKNNISEYLEKVQRVISNCKREQPGEQSLNNLNELLVSVVVENFKLIYKRNLKNYLKLQGLFEYVDFNKIEEIINSLKSMIVDYDKLSQYILNSNINNIFKNAYEDSVNEIKDILFDSLSNFLKSIDEFYFYSNNNKTTISIKSSGTYESKLVFGIYLEVLMSLDKLKNVYTIVRLSDVENISNSLIANILNGKNIYVSLDDKAEYFSCGERVYENANDKEETSNGRCIVSTTSLNLARIGLICRNKTIDDFYESLENNLDFVRNQLVQRFDFQGGKFRKNFPCLFKYDLMMETSKVEETQKIRKCLKNGALAVSIVGLGECVRFLNVENKENLTIDILGFINKKLNEYCLEEKLNFILVETKDEEVLKKMLAIDKSIYGLEAFQKGKNKYSLISNIKEDELNEKCDVLSRGIHTRVDIKAKRGSGEKEIIKLIRKANDLNIKYFGIDVSKNEN